MKCTACGKSAEGAVAWHLEGNLHFCGNACVARFIEKTCKVISANLADHESRLASLEKQQYGGGR